MAGPTKEFVAGEHYFSVFCQKCRQIIPLFHDPSRGQITFAGQGKIQTDCPHCGKTQKHRATEVASRVLDIVPATKH